MSKLDLICAPIGGYFTYEDHKMVQALRDNLAAEQRAKQKYERENIVLRRMVLALYDEAQRDLPRGNVNTLLVFDDTVEKLDDKRIIHTLHDATKNVTKIWVEK